MLIGIAAALAVWGMPSTLHGQIFVTNNDGAGLITSGGTIGKYNLDGTTINTALVSSGLDGPRGIALSESNLFVANYGFGFGTDVREYTTLGATLNTALVHGTFENGVAVSGTNLFITFLGSVGSYTTSGGTVNDSLVQGLNGTLGIAVSADGANLFVAINGDNKIGEYDTVTGAAINAALVTGLSQPTGIAISGNHLFVANAGSGTIGEYNLDGTTVNASLVTGLNDPVDLTDFDGNLFVVNNGSNSVGEYSATNGATINDALITGLNDPQGIAVVPEPATLVLMAIGGVFLFALFSQVKSLAV